MAGKTVGDSQSNRQKLSRLYLRLLRNMLSIIVLLVYYVPCFFCCNNYKLNRFMNLYKTVLVSWCVVNLECVLPRYIGVTLVLRKCIGLNVLCISVQATYLVYSFFLFSFLDKISVIHVTFIISGVIAFTEDAFCRDFCRFLAMSSVVGSAHLIESGLVQQEFGVVELLALFLLN